MILKFIQQVTCMFDCSKKGMTFMERKEVFKDMLMCSNIIYCEHFRQFNLKAKCF